jgi:hypothetical protein
MARTTLGLDHLHLTINYSRIRPRRAERDTGPPLVRRMQPVRRDDAFTPTYLQQFFSVLSNEVARLTRNKSAYINLGMGHAPVTAPRRSCVCVKLAASTSELRVTESHVIMSKSISTLGNTLIEPAASLIIQIQVCRCAAV